jgi:hypothetical protein
MPFLLVLVPEENSLTVDRRTDLLTDASLQALLNIGNNLALCLRTYTVTELLFAGKPLEQRNIHYSRSKRTPRLSIFSGVYGGF